MEGKCQERLVFLLGQRVLIKSEQAGPFCRSFSFWFGPWALFILLRLIRNVIEGTMGYNLSHFLKIIITLYILSDYNSLDDDHHDAARGSWQPLPVHCPSSVEWLCVCWILGFCAGKDDLSISGALPPSSRTDWPNLCTNLKIKTSIAEGRFFITLYTLSVDSDLLTFPMRWNSKQVLNTMLKNEYLINETVV